MASSLTDGFATSPTGARFCIDRGLTQTPGCRSACPGARRSRSAGRQGQGPQARVHIAFISGVAFPRSTHVVLP
jgi:hypothetical protein